MVHHLSKQALNNAFEGVLYQSMAIAFFGQHRSSVPVGLIRNHYIEAVEPGHVNRPAG